MSLLETAWEQREEVIYKSLFGDLGKGLYAMQEQMFTGQFGCEQIDPRWLEHGVFKCPPHGTRKTWLYVSTGLSNPWESEELQPFSGFGSELFIETEQEADWAVQVLRWLVAFNIMIVIGKYDQKRILNVDDRIPMAIEPNITELMVVTPDEYPSSFDLASGKVRLLQVVGITANEANYAQNTNSQELAKNLLSMRSNYTTDPDRADVI
jgi:hypothetical protein